MHISSPSARRARLLIAVATVLSSLSMPALADARFGDQTLRKGDSGKEVKQLQRLLDQAGYDTDVDGEYGRTTAKRVRAFEGNEELKVDGKVSPRDAIKLRAAADEGGEDTPTGQDEEESSGGGDPETGSTPGSKATVGEDGLAVAPADAPQEVKDVIEAGNEIADAPYTYGGGHGSKLKDDGYDCSGSISYALRKADLMDGALASGPLMRWADKGRGEWITVRANSGHAYMMVAGIRFDTSAKKRGGSRWTEKKRSARGYVARHPEGF